MAACLFFLLYAVFSLTILYHGLKSIVWELGSALFLLSASFIVGLPWYGLLAFWVVVVSVWVVIRVGSIREIIANTLYQSAGNILPKLTKTEEEALNAGDVWLEKDIFIGAPNWERLAGIDTQLTTEEQSFIDNETETLCSMLDEWTISQELDLPKPVWDFMKEKGFFGLVIAKEHSGKGFSARAHSDIIMKIASRSGVGAVTCMVPNSLGPGELLHYYGTEEQKKNYLPKLAKGIDIPCFALTEPNAGSDATSIQSEAIVTRRTVNGKESLGLMIHNLNKRWITLAPVATLIGLAVNLKDPDGLLNGLGQEGITCLLIPRNTENLEIGNRHLAAFQPFMNGSIRGENIFVPISSIIGGQKNAGHGWQMLVECLSIGRSISLPGLAAATASAAYISTGAFARIRRQFNVEIADFEGVEEKLAEIAGLTYLITATRLLTVAAVNEHKKPSVASAITKYYNTELARIVINDAMDVHAGRAVVVGPRNYLVNNYIGIPISVTVEGANIMSRNLLIFGQGSMACHPYVQEEFYALAREDKEGFSKLLWQHIQYFFQNFAKTLCSAWTGGVLITTPKSPLKRQYQKLSRLSYAFAFLADASLIILGGSLKRKERLSARLADAMSYLYLAMAALGNYEKNNKNADEKLHAQWGLDYCFYHAEKAMISLCQNSPSKMLGWLFRFIAFPLGQRMQYPSDQLSHQLAKSMTTNNDYRNSIKQHVYIGKGCEAPLARVENALQLMIQHGDLYSKISDLKRYSSKELKKQMALKVKKGELTQIEMDNLVKVEAARWDAIMVDEFTSESMKHKTYPSVTDTLANPWEGKIEAELRAELATSGSVFANDSEAIQ